jgi:hypothetical protein
MAFRDSGSTLRIEPGWDDAGSSRSRKAAGPAGTAVDARSRLRQLVKTVSSLPVGSSHHRNLVVAAINAAGASLLDSPKFERTQMTGNLTCHELDNASLDETLPDRICPDCRGKCQPTRTHWQTPLTIGPGRIDIANVSAYTCRSCGIGFPWEIAVQLFVHAGALAAMIGDQQSSEELARRAVAHLNAFDAPQAAAHA